MASSRSSVACRRCGAQLDVKATEKRPVSEFYALHPQGACPLSADGVRLDSEGKFIEKEKANALAVQNPDLLLNAKHVIRHADGHDEELSKTSRASPSGGAR